MSRHEVRIDKRGSLPQRLHAARVSACVMSVRRAAEILRVNASTYASWEAGRRAPQKNTVLAAGVAFGVTTDYLFSGWIVNLGDEFAARVERLLYHEARPFDTQAASTRLRRVRSKGYQTAKRAAADNGWVASTYVGHEAGTRSLPLERAIIYSISFGVRPEHVLFDEPAQADLRWMLASGAKLGLKAGRGLEEAFYLPLYDLVNGELVLQGMPLVAPSALFSKLGPYADELKGVVVARANGSMCYWLFIRPPNQLASTPRFTRGQMGSLSEGLAERGRRGACRG